MKHAPLPTPARSEAEGLQAGSIPHVTAGELAAMVESRERPTVRDVIARPYWDRGDGFDQRDPSAPPAWLCAGCDGFRETARAFCSCCEGVTDSYKIGRVS